MYLAGLIADDMQMTKKDLQRWVDNAYCTAISCNTVAWVTAQSRFGMELALKWIESKKDWIAAAGWTTIGCVVALKPDTDLNLKELEKLVERVAKTVHDQPDRVRYAMNGFIIEVGSYVASLTEAALRAAAKMGEIAVDMGETECKVPGAAEYINKVKQRGTIGKKRKTVKC
jgi:hypothetical protein